MSEPMWYVTYQSSTDVEGVLTAVGIRGLWCSVPAARKLGERTYARRRGFSTLEAAEARLAIMRRSPSFADGIVGNPQVRQFWYNQ